MVGLVEGRGCDEVSAGDVNAARIHSNSVSEVMKDYHPRLQKNIH